VSKLEKGIDIACVVVTVLKLITRLLR